MEAWHESTDTCSSLPSEESQAIASGAELERSLSALSSRLPTNRMASEQASSSKHASSAVSEALPALGLSTDNTEAVQPSTSTDQLPSTSSIPISPLIALSFPSHVAHAHAARATPAEQNAPSPPRNHFRERSVIAAAGFEAGELAWECKEGEGLRLRQEESWNEAARGRESGELPLSSEGSRADGCLDKLFMRLRAISWRVRGSTSGWNAVLVLWSPTPCCRDRKSVV